MRVIDIFCEILDNYGDIGVTYRIIKALMAECGGDIRIRLIINKLDEFRALNKKVQDLPYQEVDGLICIRKEEYLANPDMIVPGDVAIEMMQCGIPQVYLERAKECTKLIINMEYLTGESWAADFHLKESPLPDGSIRKVFYMPGFAPDTGGVNLDLRANAHVCANRQKYLEKYYGDIPNYENMHKITLFSYEHDFSHLLDALNKCDKESIILVLGAKTQNSIRHLIGTKEENKEWNNGLSDKGKKIYEKKDFVNIYKYGKIHLKFEEFLSQEEYEEALNVSDFNFVRGEDSFVRGIVARVPYVWHIYCQDNYTHMEKLQGFLDCYKRVLANTEYADVAQYLERLYIDYNYRDKDTYEEQERVSVVDYSYLISHKDRIIAANTIFLDYLKSNCNFIEKLKKIIEKI